MIVLVRGLPGSGKSTYAATLPALHIETDMYFIRGGVYKYDIKKIGIAHEWCQMNVRYMLQQGEDVVVSNTFTQLWEMQPYLDMAAELDVVVTVLRLNTQFGSTHLPADKKEAIMKAMRDRFEDYPTEAIQLL